MLSEFLDYIPLKDYIREFSCENRKYESYKSIILQIIDGVSYCHERFIIHGDINLSNIMVCPLDKKIKIIDFGSANLLSETSDNLYSPRGNPKYRPPSEEFFFDDAFKGECWSLGLILMSVVLSERITTKLAMNFSECVWEKIEELGLNLEMIIVLKGLINVNSKERMNINKVMEHMKKMCESS